MGVPHPQFDLISIPPKLPKETMSQYTPVLRGSSALGQIGVPSTAGAADNSDNTEKRRDRCVELVAAGAGTRSSGSVHPRRHEMSVGGERFSVHGILEPVVSRDEPGEANSDPAGGTPVRKVARHGKASCPEEDQDGQRTESISVQATLDSYCGTELGVTVGGLDEGTVTLGRRNTEARVSRVCGVVGSSAIDIERNIGSDVGGGRYSGSSWLSSGGGDPLHEPELHGTVDETGGASSSALGRSTRPEHPKEAGVRQPEAAKEFAVVLREEGTKSWGEEKVPAERPGAQETGMKSVRDVDGTIKGEGKDSENVIAAKETGVRETARGVNARRALQSGLDALIELGANEDRNRTARQNYDSENLPRPQAEGGSAMETATADDEESLGVEIGNSAIWEHVEGRGMNRTAYVWPSFLAKRGLQ